jgi:hypothetical protein
LLKDLPEDERAAVQSLSERTRELTDFLVSVMAFDAGKVGVKNKSIKTITYSLSHAPSRLLVVR